MVLANKGVSVRYKLKVVIQLMATHKTRAYRMFYFILPVVCLFSCFPAKQVPLNNVDNSVAIQRSISVNPAAECSSGIASDLEFVLYNCF
jgi:hypothetical protein